MRNEYGATVAGGQEHLQGKIFRVAHMGYCDQLDMVAFASVMALALRDCDWRFELGTAVATVQTAYADGGKSERSREHRAGPVRIVCFGLLPS